MIGDLNRATFEETRLIRIERIDNVEVQVDGDDWRRVGASKTHWITGREVDKAAESDHNPENGRRTRKSERQ